MCRTDPLHPLVGRLVVLVVLGGMATRSQIPSQVQVGWEWEVGVLRLREGYDDEDVQHAD